MHILEVKSLLSQTPGIIGLTSRHEPTTIVSFFVLLATEPVCF